MSSSELSAVSLLSDWYMNQKFTDINPFERNDLETAVANARDYASNYAPSMKIEYYQAGKKHAAVYHLTDSDYSDLALGNPLDFSYLQAYWNFVLLNYGFEDFEILSWSARASGGSMWLPCAPQSSFNPTPGIKNQAQYAGLLRTGYARIEGSSVDDRGFSVKASATIHGLNFAIGDFDSNDARILPSEVEGLQSIFDGLNNVTVEQCPLLSVAGKLIYWKNYVNIGFSSSGRKSLRRS
jgi:hypothetical protein